MLKEFGDWVLGLAKAETVSIDGLEYSSRPLHIIQQPIGFATIALHTLTGLADSITNKLDLLNLSEWMIIVNSHESLSLVETQTDAYGRRESLVNVQLIDGETFPFNRFLGREEFVIGLQSRFVQDATTEELLRLCSSLEASVVAISEDDGISQQTTVKQGVVLKERVVVKGRRVLRPYRTFREVEQPTSEFVFRMKAQGAEVPQCALFEADGGKWKMDAVLAIKQWLEAKQLRLPIVA